MGQYVRYTTNKRRTSDSFLIVCITSRKTIYILGEWGEFLSYVTNNNKSSKIYSI